MESEKKFDPVNLRIGLLERISPLIAIGLSVTGRELVFESYYLARSEIVERIKDETYAAIHEKNLKLQHRLNLWHRNISHDVYGALKREIFDKIPVDAVRESIQDGYSDDLLIFKFGQELFNVLAPSETNARDEGVRNIGRED